MQHGYALVYKDKDGFEIPFYQPYDGNPIGMCIVFTNEGTAQRYENKQTQILRDLLQFGRETLVKKRGFWLMFKRDIIEYIPITSEVERRNIQQIINTLKVKKVKIA